MFDWPLQSQTSPSSRSLMTSRFFPSTVKSIGTLHIGCGYKIAF
jgi:hypothetical protein